jgi:tetratricopeptide (TPR) repeat protein
MVGVVVRLSMAFCMIGGACVSVRADPAVDHQLGALAHFTRGEFNQAITDSTAALRAEPNYEGALRLRGLAQLYAGRPKAAIGDFAAAVRLKPSDALGVILLHLARVRAQQSDDQEFAANVARVVRLDRVCEARVYLGLLQLAAKDKDEARKLFSAAVSDCPPGAAVAGELAMAKLELRRLGNAPVTATPERRPPSVTPVAQGSSPGRVNGPVQANAAAAPTHPVQGLYMKIQDRCCNPIVGDGVTVGQRQPTLFRVQPTVESVREGLALKGPYSPAELGLKNAIERSANELRDKIIICASC